MKKTVYLLILLCTVTGCSADGGKSTVSTDGSTSMERVIGYLSEVYMEQNPEVKVTFNPTGSGAGIQAVADGRCDIGLSSRELTDTERETLTETVVAIDGIAVIVNNKNPITDLTVDEIRRIYTGEITSWQELGGAAAPIVRIGREAASGTRDGFEAVTGTRNKCKYTQELTSAGDVNQTVAANPNAIGYTSVAAVKDTVRAVTVDGVKADNGTIQSGKYKLQRDFIFVTQKGVPLSSEVQSFFDFAVSETAGEWIIRAGATPVD